MPKMSIARTQFAPSTFQKTVRKFFCRPYFGRLIAKTSGNQIRFGNATIDTSSHVIDPLTKAAIFWGTYEEVEADLVDRFVDPALHVLEIGASLGVISARIARRLLAGRALICVEPNPACTATLEANLRINAGHLKTTVVNKALWSGQTGADKTMRMNVTDINSARIESAASDPNTGSTVETVRFSDLLALLPDEPLSLVIDIEGAEVPLLLHEEANIRRARQLIMELHETEYEGRTYSVDWIADRITNLGFECQAAVMRNPGLGVFVFNKTGSR